MESHHPSSDKVSHPCPHCSNLHKALIPDAHVFCHHVRPAREEDQDRKGHLKKNAVYFMRVVKAGREVRREGQKEPTEGGPVQKKWSLMLSIIMLAVRINQYQSNPVKTMRDGFTFHKALRIVNNLHQRNRFYTVSPLSFGLVLFGKLSICLANLSRVLLISHQHCHPNEIPSS